MRVTFPMRHESGDLTRQMLRAAHIVFLVAGILMLGFAGYAFLDQYWYQRTELSKFEAVAAAVPAKPPAIVAVPIADGGVIGELEVPRLKLKAMVVQGDSEQLLRRAVGHLPETALPGETGNVALAGHRDGIFRPLRNVLPGDFITFRTPDRVFQYQVEWTAVVSPNAVRVIEPTSEPALTLVTCFPFYYVGAAPERFVVRARRIEGSSKPADAP